MVKLMPRLYLDEVSEALNCHQKTIQRWIKRSLIKPEKHKGKYTFRKPEIEKLQRVITQEKMRNGR